MANAWYAFYPGDYGRDTAHLSMVEDSAYRRLLDHYYSTERPISTNVEHVVRICRAFAPGEQEAVRFVLQQFFTEQSDGWHNRRVDLELQKRQEIAEKRSKAGKVSAQKRSPSSSTHEPTSVEQVFTQPQSQPQILSPSSPAGFCFSSENNTLTTGNPRAREERFTPRDHIEKDLRKIREAEKEVEPIVRAQPKLGADEVDELICERAGISVIRLFEAREFQRLRPISERASA
jgi:uncharacterized protein YdaU (DUF1376 family)